MQLSSGQKTMKRSEFLTINATVKKLRWDKRLRLLQRGFMKVDHIYFQEVYAPASHYATTRLVLTVSVALKHIWWVLNSKNGFVNATLIEAIFMSQPDGFVKLGNEDWVRVLRTSFYKQWQASREWYLTLQKYLSVYRFAKSKADPTMFACAKMDCLQWLLSLLMTFQCRLTANN